MAKTVAQLSPLSAPTNDDFLLVWDNNSLNSYKTTVSQLFTNIPNGTVGSPSFTFVNDNTTGVYSIGSGQLGISISGSNKVTVNSIGIGINKTPSYPLDIGSTSAIRLPVGNTTDRDAITPVTGLIRYNTTSGTFEGRDASSWRSFVESGDSSSVLNFTQSGTGAVTRTVDNKLKDWVSIQDFGVVGDGVVDDTTTFQAAATYAASSGKGIFCPPGYTIRLTQSVNLSGIRDIDIRSNILITTGTLTVGGGVNSGQFFVNLEGVTNGNSPVTGPVPGSPVLRLVGASNSFFAVGNCNYIQLYADAGNTQTRLFAYNQLRLTGSVGLLEVTDSGVALSYVNENAIYAARIIRYRIIGVGYPHNHNKLFHPCMEGSNTEITITGNLVSCNYVYGARFESASSSPGVTFGAGTYSNTVTSDWSGTGNPRNQFINGIPVNDSGSGNMVATESSIQFKRSRLFDIGPMSQILGTLTDCVAPDFRIAPQDAGITNLSTRAVLVPSLNGVNVPQAFRWVALTEPIPVRLGDVVRFDSDYDGSLARPYVFALGENQQPLTNNTDGEFISMPSGTFNSTYGLYAAGSNLTSSTFNQQVAAVTRSEVKFIRVGVILGAAGFVRYLGASLYTQALGRVQTEACERFTSLRSLDGIPTRGYAPLNTVVWDRTAGVMRRCTFQYETLLSAALSSGDTSVTVSNIGSVTNSDVVGILLDNGETHWSTVSSVSGSSFTIAAVPTGRSAPLRGRVVFNRWA